MSGFSPDWLALREPFDHAARASELAEALRHQLAGRPVPWRLLELAGGTGSGVRWLGPRLGTSTRWWVLDHDSVLLAHLNSSLATPVHGDVRDFEHWPDVDAVHLQALLDLVDLDFLVGLADAVTTRQIPVLAGLTVDGRVVWDPPHPDDARVMAAFRLHQLGDRGFGDSVGIFAARIFADLLTVRGYAVQEARADWTIATSQEAMVQTMVNGTAEAAAEVGVDVSRWRADRLATRGEVSLVVGHRDVLGHPGRG